MTDLAWASKPSVRAKSTICRPSGVEGGFGEFDEAGAFAEAVGGEAEKKSNT